MEYEILRFEKNNQTGIIQLHRPEALNALNTRFFEEMNSMLDELESDSSLRCLIITGIGKAFVAGADIAEMVHKSQHEASVFSEFGQATFSRIENFRIPVIAAINGFALGGGLELALSCDFRIASENARFGQPEVNLGLIPGYAATQRLPRLAGMGNALFLLITGEMIDANEALRMGIIQKIFTVDALMNECMTLAQKISSKGPKAVEMVKAVSRKGIKLSFDDACKLEATEFGQRFETSESSEGMNAFLEKRKPNW